MLYVSIIFLLALFIWLPIAPQSPWEVVLNNWADSTVPRLISQRTPPFAPREHSEF